MKKIFPSILIIFVFSLVSFSADAQIRKIPASVTDSFREKYPNATGVEWRDKLSSFTAVFTVDGVNYEAKYSGKGEWQSTENELEPEALPDVVNQGFEKSKYTDWNIEKVHRIQLPGDVIQYRIQIGKGDVQKKNLLFNDKGRLLRDRITLP